MLGLPASTDINKQVPKKAIFAKFELKPAQRDHFDEDVAKLTLVNAISPTTIPALSKGEQIDCIYVMAVTLKKKEYDPKNILLLSKLIPQKILFALKYEDYVQLAINHTKLICGDWQPEQDYSITLQGLNLDKVWESLVVSIGGITVEAGSTLEQQIQFDDARAKVLKQIKQLEAKARSEKQPKKKLLLFELIQQLKNEYDNDTKKTICG